jgi:hypothetical protein
VIECVVIYNGGKMEYCIIFIVLVLVLLLYLVLKTKNQINKERTIGELLTISGIGLIGSSFPNFVDRILNFLEGVLINETKINQNDVNYISLIMGFILVIVGLKYSRNNREKFFVLNFLSKDKKLISNVNNLKSLKISDFKLKEQSIDVVRMFRDGDKITTNGCGYMVEEIKEKTKDFINQSNDNEKGFTGMFSVPFTILAGTYLSAIEIDEYFEYNRSTGKYYALKPIKWYGRKISFPKLHETNQKTNKQSQEVVVALSITKNIIEEDLRQFGQENIFKIGLENPKDNIIEFKEQLNDYAQSIVDSIEHLKSLYSDIKTLHLVAAIPSCLSVELGRRISLNRNRLPMIIAYHYKYDEIPKYNFGLIINGNDTKGKLVKTRQESV